MALEKFPHFIEKKGRINSIDDFQLDRFLITAFSNMFIAKMKSSSHRWTLILKQVELLFSHLGVVHVSERRGVDTERCGTARRPCKTLGMGVAVVNDSGTVLIEGNQQINQTIMLKKSICIRASNKRSILSTGIVFRKKFYAFQTDAKKMNVTFVALEVHDMVLLNAKDLESLSFRISNCYLIGLTKYVYHQIYLDRYRKLRYIAYSIENSVYENTGAITFEMRIPVSFLIKNTIFNKSRDIEFGEVMNGQLLNSSFYEAALRAKKCKYVLIQFCRFYRISYLQFYSWTRKTEPPIQSYIRISNSILNGTWNFRNTDRKGLYLSSFYYVRILQCRISYFNFPSDEVKAPVKIFKSKNVTVSNVICENNVGYHYLGGCMHLKSTVGVQVRISQFRRNIARSGGAIYAENSVLVVERCEFYGNFGSDGGSIHIVKIKGRFARINLNHLTTLLEARKSKFVENKASTKGGSIFTKGIGTILSHCFFSNSSSQNIGGGIAAIGGTLSIDNCKFRMDSAVTAGAGISFEKGYSKGNEYVELRDSLLQQCKAPAISIDSIKISILRTILIARDDAISPHIQLRAGQITLESFQTIVIYPKTVQSNVMITVMKVTSLNTNMDIPTGLNLTCSPNFKASVTQVSNSEGLNDTRIESKCVSCPPNMYTISNTYSSTNSSLANSCLKCPPGASCNGLIRSLDNFWGQKVGGEIVLFPCHSGFCCSSQSTPCLSYNTCNRGRTGIFCGSCENNNMQSYMTDACIPKGTHQCNAVLFVIYFVFTSLAYTTIFTFLPRIIDIMKGIGSRCLKNRNVEEKETNDVDEDEQFPFAAFVTMVIFFFQIASLVHVDILKQKNETKNETNTMIMKIIFEVFNFRLAIS